MHKSLNHWVFYIYDYFIMFQQYLLCHLHILLFQSIQVECFDFQIFCFHTCSFVFNFSVLEITLCI